MPAREEILAANESYAATFDKGDLPPPPARRLAVVTCMDARLDPARFLGLAEGDAHVIRNAGGHVTGASTSDIDFHPFTDLEESVRSSVRRIAESPLLPDAFEATGFVYDVRSGRLQEVA